MKAKFINTLKEIGFQNKGTGNLQELNEYYFESFKLILGSDGWLLLKDNKSFYEDQGFNSTRLFEIISER